MPLAFTHTKQASCRSSLAGVCVSVIDVCTEPQLLEDTAPRRHISPPQKHSPRYLDATKNPKAAEAQLQGPWVGWGMRLSIPALAKERPGRWQVHATRLVFSVLQPRQEQRSTWLPPTHCSALLPQLHYGLPLGTGLLDTSFCPKNSSARPRHRCVFLNGSCR